MKQICVEERMVSLPSVTLNVKSCHCERKKAPHLLVVHGGPDWDHSYLSSFLSPMGDAIDLTFFDLRGCGRSQKFGLSEKYGIIQAADDLRDLIIELGLDQPIIMGFSFGGRVLLNFIARYPKLVSKAILASSTAYTNFSSFLTKWEEYIERKTPILDEKIQNILSDKSIRAEEKSRQLAFTTAALDIYNLTYLPLYQNILKKINFSGEWMSALQSGHLNQSVQPDYESSLRAWGGQLLILHGEKDMRFPMEVAVRLHQAVSNSQLAIIPSAGHMAHIEGTEVWMSTLKSFVFDKNDQKKWIKVE